MNSNAVIEEILNSVPDKLMESNDIKTLKLRSRYLYLELCKRCHYSIEYHLGNPDEKNEFFNNNIDTGTGFESVCNDFCLTGAKLFKKAGIEAMAVDIDENEYKGQYMSNPKHVFFIFSFGERDLNGNKKYYLGDPSFDLKRIQIGCKTKYFASHPNIIKNRSGYPKYLTSISQPEIEKMDEVLGYCTNGIYTDDIVAKIIRDIEKVDPEGTEYDKLTTKIEELLSQLKEKVHLLFNSNIGISDRQSSYKMIFHEAFPKEMSSHIIDFDTEKTEDGKYLSRLIVKMGNNESEYVYIDEKGEYWFTREETETIIGDEEIER